MLGQVKRNNFTCLGQKLDNENNPFTISHVVFYFNNMKLLRERGHTGDIT